MTESAHRQRLDDDALWSQLAESLSAQLGFHYPVERRADLIFGIAAAASAFGMDSVQQCARWLASAPLSRAQIETLARCLTVGETYFFRDRPAFAALQNTILPQLLSASAGSRRSLRIWSAGCCSGEEPYSIAIQLHRSIPDLSEWDVSILATDIDPDFLRKAEIGIYSEWSFRDIPAGIKETYFRPTGKGQYRIDERIRRMVRFEFLNLADDVYPSPATATQTMDLVFCRNVLMYFAPARAAEAVRRLARCLRNDGWLLVSSVEAALVDRTQFLPVQFGDATFYRRCDSLPDQRGPVATLPPPPATVAAVLPAAKRDAAPRHAANTPAQPLQRTVAVAPASADALSPEQLCHQGRYEEARTRLLALAALHPDESRASALLAKCCANLGLLDEAVAWCERAQAIDKLDAGLCCLLADIHQQQGDEDRAMRALQRALYLEPDNALAHFSLGNLIRRRDRGARAERHLRTALELLDKCPDDQVLAGSEGLTAGRLAQILRATEPFGASR